MILGDREIRDRLSTGSIVVEPLRSKAAIQPASLDVRMGNELLDTVSGTLNEDNSFVLEPNRFYLGTTLETVALPLDVAAQLAGRSTMGRKGIVVHKTAGWIDPGFRGQITLEMYNFSAEAVEIVAGERIAQLVFFQTLTPTNGYDGQYQDQQGVTQ